MPWHQLTFSHTFEASHPTPGASWPFFLTIGTVLRLRVTFQRVPSLIVTVTTSPFALASLTVGAFFSGAVTGWRMIARVARLPAVRWSASTAAISGATLRACRASGAPGAGSVGIRVCVACIGADRPYAALRATGKGPSAGPSGAPASISGCAATARRCC